MSFGSSLILIFVLCCILYAIYKITQKHKWKLVLKALGVIVLLILLISAGVSGYFWYKNLPHEVSTLGKISLGMSPVDVTLKLGIPTSGYNEDESPKSYLYKGYSTIQYIVLFDENDRAALICSQDYSNEVFGLGVYDDEEKIIKKLGEPTNVSINETGTSKMISYSQYKVAFDVEKGDVKTVCITESGKATFNNELN